MPEDLRTWAERMAPHGHVQARQVLVLLAQYESAEAVARCVDNHVTALEADLTAAQASVLTEGMARNDAEARVKALEADLALARRTILQLTERVAAQSELLSRRAEKTVSADTVSV